MLVSSKLTHTTSFADPKPKSADLTGNIEAPKRGPKLVLAAKLAMLLWAMKYHKGEQRLHAGIWKTVDEALCQIGPWPSNSRRKDGRSERRTHVDEAPYDYMVPPVFSDETIQDQVHRGLRPPVEEITGLFWASGPCGNGDETRTWTLPSWSRSTPA
eukprot:s2216_g6.t1